MSELRLWSRRFLRVYFAFIASTSSKLAPRELDRLRQWRRACIQLAPRVLRSAPAGNPESWPMANANRQPERLIKSDREGGGGWRGRNEVGNEFVDNIWGTSHVQPDIHLLWHRSDSICFSISTEAEPSCSPDATSCLGWLLHRTWCRTGYTLGLCSSLIPLYRILESLPLLQYISAT